MIDEYWVEYLLQNPNWFFLLIFILDFFFLFYDEYLLISKSQKEECIDVEYEETEAFLLPWKKGN